MTRRDKLVEKIRRRPPDAAFDDVKRLLEAFDWTFDRQVGSHTFFVKPNERTISVPLVSGRKVKRRYLDEICERLGLDD